MGDGARCPAFAVLGRLAITVAGQALPLDGPSVRGLLGVLLLSPGEPVADDRLLTLVWGPEAGSRRALQCAVSRLRDWLCARLGLADCLVRADGGYQIEVPAQSVDVARFWWWVRLGADDTRARVEHLRAALDEWRGPCWTAAPNGCAATRRWRASKPRARAARASLPTAASSSASPGSASPFPVNGAWRYLPRPGSQPVGAV